MPGLFDWSRTARGILPLTEQAGDQPTADLLTQRLTVHEQTAWMLRSLLKQWAAGGGLATGRRRSSASSP
jgi:hypothetical protein